MSRLSGAVDARHLYVVQPIRLLRIIEAMCPELVGDIYRDEGISGTLGPEKRPGLAGLLAAVDAGAVQAVIVLDLSRLARSVKLVTSMIESFNQAGISFVSCKERFSHNTCKKRNSIKITLTNRR